MATRSFSFNEISFLTTRVIHSCSQEVLGLNRNVQKNIVGAVVEAGENHLPRPHSPSWCLHGLRPLPLLPPLRCRPRPKLLYCPYLHMCVRACVSSCTHIQLMKCKCLAAVVTVVRLSRDVRSKDTQQLDLSWSKQRRRVTDSNTLLTV